MPGGGIHKNITLNAIKNIPEWEKKFIDKKVEENMCKLSLLPDIFFDIKGDGYYKAIKYTYFIDNIQFHYLPDYNLEKEYKFWVVKKDKKGKPYILKKLNNYENKNWKHFYKGFNYYFKKAIVSLQNENFDDFAGFLGVILHTIQDATISLHSIEGYEGTDIFILDRLIEPPSSDLKYLPTSILLKEMPVPEFSFLPSLLGEKEQEVTFILYSELYKIVEKTRKLLIPIVLNSYENKKEEVNNLYRKMFLNSSKLCADVIHTIFCIAFKKFRKDEKKKLKKIYLSDLKPVKKPCVLFPPYRFTPILKDTSIDINGKKIPLSLCVNGKIKRFSKGFSTGSHYEYTISFYIPEDVYKTFSCYLGLHSHSGKNGNVNINIKFRKRLIFKKHFKGNLSAEKVEFSVKKGGLLEFIVKSPNETNNPENNIVFGAPLLEK